MPSHISDSGIESGKISMNVVERRDPHRRYSVTYFAVDRFG